MKKIIMWTLRSLIFLSLVYVYAFGGITESLEVASLPEPNAPSLEDTFSGDPLLQSSSMSADIHDAIVKKLELYAWAPRIEDDEINKMTKSIIWGWKEYGIPPSLTLSIMEQESAFDYKAKSYVGALGLMQVMPRYAKKPIRQLGIKGSVNNILFTPHLNIKVGITMLNNFFIVISSRGYAHRNVALMAYNAGESNAFKFYSDRRPSVKGEYAKLVLRHMSWYKSEGII